MRGKDILHKNKAFEAWGCAYLYQIQSITVSVPSLSPAFKRVFYKMM